MGRAPSYERQQFDDTGLPKENDRAQLVCKHCLAAYTDPARTDEPPVPKVISARSTTFKNHLKACKYYKEALARGNVRPPQVPPRVLSGFTRKHVTSNPSEDASSTTTDKRQRFIRDYFDNVFSDEKHEEFERLLIQFQADNCLPDRFVEKKSTVRLFTFLNKACAGALPKRKDMSRILDKYSRADEEDQFVALKNRLEYSGGRLNFLSDVWQNVVKVHLLGCMLALFGTIVNFGLFSTGSRHDGVAIGEQMEFVMKDINAKGWQIGAVVTDDAGQCGRARRILALRHPRIAFIRCFAHDVNNLVKSVLNSSFQSLTKKASLATVTLNASSSKWLVRAHTVLKSTYGKSLGFINLCETRWNSMQGCFASLLRVRNGLHQFAVKYMDDAEFPEALHVFRDPNFWQQLEAAERVIRPLSNASYKLQRDENTLADVVVCYRDIYRGFLGDFDNLELVSIIDKRWQKCEQPLMLLALFLHPRHVHVAVAMHQEAPQLRLLERLCGYGVYYYRRFVASNEESDVESILDDFHAWYRGVFVDATLVRFNGDVGHFWSFAGDVKRDSKLPKLASVILSIAVNTATCERYFSELAAIHTAVRNRMKPDKARKFSLVRQAMRKRDNVELEGDERTELKRIVDPDERKRIGNCDTTPSVTMHEIEENTLVENQEAPGADTTDYWQSVFNVLETVSDDDEEQESPQDNELEQIIYNGFDEAIPAPDMTEFPRTNVKTFPQETRLTGVRGQKFSLSTLFTSDRTFGLTPYMINDRT
ncbi:hypothetical protein P3T76_003565 [Phytophthora citrophthora]|uniref:HAT C-terminal dimerisation domain-containing protein n=1 Tax=Phytophthora citrophthora TaxID=4793 RepID=A0AAD9GEM1_9STRA|nr:hypothetical protein P3T76_014747 [Phytophthora citrophthora]KAK1937039.1 hypothetical protein P3T76_009817 [Phytophthora citrophthora]KAK1942556.1 hypothetical protein P3T76_006055 [Phytophthora citrophthora]KAK1945032.1 hypothetical protein P3T76_003565 [Phytophthora citrophthora]